MAAASSTAHMRPPSLHNNGLRRHPSTKHDPGEPSSSSTQVAHTLTACTRCRQRKTRCDPGLPRCSPCERTNSVCEYYDSNKGHNVNRNYVVYLQHKVRELEEELERVENEDSAEDPETMMRAATVRIHEAKESKFLGPSSGIAITRLVMQLAKQFTDSQSIKEIVPEHRAQEIKALYQQEQAKPTSKIYPLISDVAAVDLPNRALTNLLVQLYKLKVQPMYPALHEPTLDNDIEDVYRLGAGATYYQQFVTRMVIAISLQKMDTQYAGLADSYYLAALKNLEPVVKPMDLRTLQAFALMAEYSLLTPTRTAIYYVVGIAVRLAQALGYNEEKTITRGRSDGKADFLEIDMRRRLFWCVLVMEFGLSHSLGRPAMLATGQEHIDVGWFETCDDEYIKPEGIDPAAPRPTLKKWIAIHFFKMRMLQLEIRRKLYLRKRSEPRSDSDPWFIQMDAKLTAWRDAAPSQDEGIGLDKVWFIGRYNTMVVFLYRPSPQVPRPSLDAALKCFNACEYNIYMQREQITKKNVDLTWIFTQSIFMAINTMLWALSYDEVRRRHNRESVQKHLDVAMEAIQLASERWPGVASAVQLYHNLIDAVLKIYEKDGDVPISAASPSDAASPNAVFSDSFNRSRGTSPATVASSSVATPPDKNTAPFGHLSQQARRSVEQPPPLPYSSDLPRRTTPPVHRTPSANSTYPQQQPHSQMHGIQPDPIQNPRPQQQQQHPQYYDPYAQFTLPPFTPNLTVPGWTAATDPQPAYAPTPFNPYHTPLFDPTHPSYPFPSGTEPFDPNAGLGAMGGEGPMGVTAFTPGIPGADQFMQQHDHWDMDAGDFGVGLTADQQSELMRELETDGMEDIRGMISHTLAAIGPKGGQGQGGG